MTEAFVNVLNVKDKYPIYQVDNYTEINNYLHKAEFLVVVTAGNAIIERDIIWNKLHTIPDNIGMIAHLLQYNPDEIPYIHEQFFILRTEAFSKLDFTAGKDVGCDLVRSQEDMHHGNAPLYVEKGIRIIERNFKFGSKLIIECLDNNFKAYNFDQEWRWPTKSNGYVNLPLPCRGYCYPDKSTALFSQCLKTLKIVPGLDESQEMFINGINQAMKFQVLNAVSYDEVPVVATDHIVAPANGFLGEMMAVKSKANKITFYDVNKNNIEFKKHLYANWDGIDYNKFATDWAMDRELAIEPVLDTTQQMSLERYPDIEEFYQNWKNWKPTVEFIHCDLIGNPERITSKLTPTSVIHTSTILTIFPFSHIIYESADLDNVKNLIKLSNCTWIQS